MSNTSSSAQRVIKVMRHKPAWIGFCSRKLCQSGEQQDHPLDRGGARTTRMARPIGPGRGWSLLR
jgi:hypothetical protein